MAGVFSLLIALSVSIIVNRIASMALMFTGLSKEAANFQARSAFTGVGFATSEAELIVNHPVRRRIIMVLMLLGNIGIATVIATVMVSISSTSDASLSRQLMILAILSIGLTTLWLLASSRAVERSMNKVIAWALQRFTDLDACDYVALLQLSDGYAVSEMLVDGKNWLAGKQLHESRLREEGILVLGIHDTHGKYQGIPRATDEIHAGDTLIIYGNINDLRAIDRRRAGAAGDKQHYRNVRRKQQLTQTEHEQA